MTPKFAVPGLRAVPRSGSLKGYLETTYEYLVEVLGEPHFLNGDKTTVEWCFGDENGVSFSIYDWKESPTPKGLYRWHIGGNSIQSMQLAMEVTGTGNVQSAEMSITKSRVQSDIAHLILQATLAIHDSIKDDEAFNGYEGSLQNVQQLTEELYELFCNNKQVRTASQLEELWFEQQCVGVK